MTVTTYHCKNKAYRARWMLQCTILGM